MSHVQPSRPNSAASGGNKKYSAGGLLLVMMLVVGYAVIQAIAPSDVPRKPDVSSPTGELTDHPPLDVPQESTAERPHLNVDDSDAETTSAARSPKMPASRPSASTASPAAPSVVVKDVTIRDQSGRVVFKGNIDLTTTLKRIARGERLSFPHDGTVFRNRERRLPARSNGYYLEWVHPTPKLSGPGPQRIVTGQQGEAFYTHDHYATFRKIR